MALMLGKLYDALRAANGIGEEKAREAAEEVAGYEKVVHDLRGDFAALKSDVRLVQWMLGVVLLMTVGLFWQVLRLGETIAAVAAKVGVP